MSLLDYTPAHFLLGNTNRGDNEFRGVDPNGFLAGQANSAGQFANQGQQGFAQAGQQSQAQIAALQALQAGKNWVSAEQLRQGLQQNVAGQMAMAASANPRNAAMMARTGSINAANMGSGLAGQQAMAGLAERNQATQNLSQFLANQQQMQLQAALQGRQNALQGYGAIEQARTGRFTGLTQTPTQGEQLLGAGMGAASIAAMSDRRLKKNIEDGGEAADKLVDGLRAHLYDYKDGKYGVGKQLGIMAQDLEKAGLSQAIIETPEGKAVHGAKLGLGLAAAVGRIGERLSKIEGKG